MLESHEYFFFPDVEDTRTMRHKLLICNHNADRHVGLFPRHRIDVENLRGMPCQCQIAPRRKSQTHPDGANTILEKHCI